MEDLIKRIKDLESEVNKLRAENEKLGVDPVTNVSTRRRLEEDADRAFNRIKRQNGCLAAIILDIDHFKSVNDNCGHAVGDKVLRAVAQTLESHVRNTDVFGRYGGEEFVAVLEAASPEGVAVFADRMRAAIASLDVEGCPSVTISLGCALLEDSHVNVWDVVKAADAALYQAKKTGRNKVCWAWRQATETKKTISHLLEANRIEMLIDPDYTAAESSNMIFEFEENQDLLNDLNPIELARAVRQIDRPKEVSQEELELCRRRTERRRVARSLDQELKGTVAHGHPGRRDRDQVKAEDTNFDCAQYPSITIN